jgi:hypothetical protein
VDWESLQHGCGPYFFATLPLEAPEGILGAVTVATFCRPLSEHLFEFLRVLTPQLAQCLAFAKCKLDVQV